ncbi:hypothetical protein [Burkholderia metallica]
MLAEHSDAPRDATILAHYGTEDLDLETVQAYRQIFSSLAPTHPFIAQSLRDVDPRAELTDRAGGGLLSSPARLLHPR